MQARKSTDIFGIDVSHYNGNIDWPAVKYAGVNFVYVKATEGATYLDPSFASYVSGARSAGIPVGAYHFARPTSNDAKVEAAHFVDAMRKSLPDFGDIMPVLDLEAPTDASQTNGTFLATWSRTFINAVAGATGKPVMLYTGGWFVNQFGGLNNALKDIPLWISNYNHCADGVPDCGGWTQWTVWQYSESGTVAGISGNVDLDVAVSLDALKGVITLKIGDSGSNVTKLQQGLTALGYAVGAIDGKFGPATDNAVKAFQNAMGFTVDGVVGPKTLSAIENPVYPELTVQINGKPFVNGIKVGIDTYVMWTVLSLIDGNKTQYKGNGLMNVNGKDVQGVVYRGNTYLPWHVIAPGVKAVQIDGGSMPGWNFVTPAPIPQVTAPASPTPAAPAPVDIKTQAFNEAKQLGIIKSDEWLTKLDEPAPVWFVIVLVLNAIKYLGGKR